MSCVKALSCLGIWACGSASRLKTDAIAVNICRQFHKSRHQNVSAKSEETEMVRQLRARIRMNGPISLADYMREVLTNPVAGYYMNRDVFGTKGDFITSPEISQMFGELLGVWCIHEWMQIGSPADIQVVELGPGRGTLADDMLRVFSQFQDIRNVVSLHLVEVSPALSKMQADKLADKSVPVTTSNNNTDEGSSPVCYQSCKSKYGPHVHWYKQLADVPRSTSFYVAHEFFDALPIHKFQKDDGRWHEVLVDVEDEDKKDGNHLRLVRAKRPTAASKILLEDAIPDTDTRDHVEVCPEGGVLAQELANRIAIDGGFGLIADYGHLGEKTDTFRAFRDHKLADALEAPGTADLTADVDFAYLQRMISDRCAVYGPVTQESFLNNMGIGYRLQALLGNANADQRKDLITGYDMLTNPRKMGERFKFMAMTRHRPGQYMPAGFVTPK